MSKVLFVNLTRLCNVNCPRCYLTPTNRASKLAMPEGMLTRILTSKFFSDADAAPVTVIFQGGEPTVVGEKAFVGYAEEVRAAAPGARMTMVSNLLAMPDWAIDASREYFGGNIETTWAAGMKKTLAGNEDAFQERFARTLRSVIDAGLTCPVNVELNRETFRAGPRSIVDLAKMTGATDFAIDFSVRFNDFRIRPSFLQGNYPALPGSISNVEFRDFAVGLRRALFSEGLQDMISCNVLGTKDERKRDMAFNTCREADFVTVNPDGTVTTNPLFSDIIETHLGSLSEQSLDEILEHPNRQMRIDYEFARRSQGVCVKCPVYEFCEGGPSHLPVMDGSGECVGPKGLLVGLL